MNNSVLHFKPNKIQCNFTDQMAERGGDGIGLVVTSLLEESEKSKTKIFPLLPKDPLLENVEGCK